jgi:hypothetical protein
MTEKNVWQHVYVHNCRVCVCRSEGSRQMSSLLMDPLLRREIITVRSQSYVLRLQKYWPPPPPTPLSARPLLRGGGHTRRVEKGVGGQYFRRRKTQLCTLPISNPLLYYLTTILSYKTLKSLRSYTVYVLLILKKIPITHFFVHVKEAVM